MAKQATKENKNTKAVKQDVKNSKEIPYHKLTIECVCGATFESGSTLDSLRVDICSKCHPYFTGDNRIVDAEGRVEKFKKKYNMK